jgi:transcriptional regulator with XRE-family HTH domain
MSTPEQSRWEQPGFSDITGAARSAEGVQVQFANGDTVTVDPGMLGLTGADYSVEVDPDDPSSVHLRTDDGTRTVDWSAIRAATDSAFARELRDRDAKESRRIARRLRAMREDRGLAQSALAKLVDMPAPQLAKLEKGESDMRLSTVHSLLRAMDATFAEISGSDAPEVSVTALSRLAKKAGAPDAVLKRIAGAVSRSQFAAALSRGFGWSSGELHGGQLGTVQLPVEVLFKARGAEPHDSPLLPLAHTISAISASVCEGPVSEVPADPAELRRAMIPGGEGPLTLDMLLAWVWSAGILVIPMTGPGGFSAAVWAVEQRPVIVLKEQREMLAYWLFDLAHELGHIAHGHLGRRGVVELTSPREGDRSDPQEREANAYALDLLVPGHQELVADIRERSQANGPLLFKGAVEQVARTAQLNPALLGVVASYELTDIARPRDRWGSTQNLGKAEGSGRKITERHFAANIALTGLKDLDAALIRALVLSS